MTTPLKNTKVITANRLIDGDAVWLGTNGQWLDRVDNALVIESKEQLEAQMVIAMKSDADNYVVEPYDIDVNVESGKVVPTKFREVIRTKGPTVRTDLGKQGDFQAHAA
jgi:hypothetical protein